MCCFDFLCRPFRRARPQVLVATGTRLGERSRRSSRELRSRALPGRIQISAHVRRNRSARPWRRASADEGDANLPPRTRRLLQGFTERLVEIVRRNDLQRLLERQQADIERHAMTLQTQIDALTLRRERSDGQPLDDALRAERILLRQSIKTAAQEQAKLEIQEVSVRNQLDRVLVDQSFDEDELFAAVPESIEANVQTQGYISLTDGLRERFRDARQLRDFLRRQREALRLAQRELADMQKAESSVAPLVGRERTLKDLIPVEPTEDQAQHPAATGYNDDPGIPPLHPGDVGKYQRLRDALVEFRKDHDEHAMTCAERHAEFVAANPSATPSDWDRRYKQVRGKDAADLHMVEKAFFAVRDRVLAAGGDMLRIQVDPDWDDLEIFAGRHLEDGTLGCVSAAYKRAMADQAERDRPGVQRWLNSTTSEDAGGDGVRPTRSEDGEEVVTRSELTPWDSLSSLERRPRASARLRRQQEQAALLRATLLKEGPKLPSASRGYTGTHWKVACRRN
ncbi:hypothetical protein LTR85_002509 [Meristemomyces frigidus]|nr:hypothetical protein LTR85_002509 [Meristemomyces frigidus]